LKHNIHFIAIDKAKLAAAQQGQHAVINCKIPYQLGFNYLVSYIEAYVKHQLGKSARGMIILDEKEMYQLAAARSTHRVQWRRHYNF
jgi:hypothetical protein